MNYKTTFHSLCHFMTIDELSWIPNPTFSLSKHLSQNIYDGTNNIHHSCSYKRNIENACVTAVSHI